MTDIEIVTVASRSELKDFIDLPWTIYAEHPQWVPPLKKEVRRMLDSGTHPFWEFSERILFLARRGKKTVGRIAGIIDRHHNAFHREQMGIWGFFECADDPEAASALFCVRGNVGSPEGDDLHTRPAQPVHQLRGGFAH
jgi:hypothetical protein